MARYIELDQEKIKRLTREAQQFQDDIVCAIGTDFMQKIAEAENKMIFDILKGLENEPSADVVPRSEVEQLENELAKCYIELDKSTDFYCSFTKSKIQECPIQDEIKKAKQEVAREIFDGIEYYLNNFRDNFHFYTWWHLNNDLTELKKKYIGE